MVRRLELNNPILVVLRCFAFTLSRKRKTHTWFSAQRRTDTHRSYGRYWELHTPKPVTLVWQSLALVSKTGLSSQTLMLHEFEFDAMPHASMRNASADL